jgi:hypothetical protein
MRVLLWLVMVCALASIPGRADAAMMAHYDLAGLIAQSDAVVLAERGELLPNDKGVPLRRYKIVRVLRGASPGDHVDVWDGAYVTAGHTLDPRAVLFLARRDGNEEITLSGLRVIEGGKVFRFEQPRNPGLYEMVPQGEDPVDHWRAGTSQLDLAALEAAIVQAGARVDLIGAVRANRDLASRRAMALALVPTASDVTARGFYDDVVTHRLEAVLVAAGDLPGALMLDQRDHTAHDMRRGFGELAALLALADPGPHPEMPRSPADDALRATALEVAAAKAELATPATERAAITLLGDPDPRVRAAAVRLAALAFGQDTSDRAEQKQVAQAQRDARAALAARYTSETDPRVVFALIEVAARDHDRAMPAHATPPLGARLALARGMVEVELACPHAPMRIGHLAITATATGGSGAPIRLARYALSQTCSDGKQDNPADPGALAHGHYQIGLALDVDQRHIAISLGGVTVDRVGELVADP